MTIQQESFQVTANTIMKELKKRNMEGFFCKDSKEMVSKVLSMLPEHATIGAGGSATLKETGLLAEISSHNYTYLDRSIAQNEQEDREIFSKTVLADAYFMSTNAITLNGELVNIDGAGNRLSCLLYGPKEIYVIVGMNKVVSDIPSAVNRIRTYACPANTVRLHRNTPCALTGKCGNCFLADSICSQLVITRRSGKPGRIKIFLVAENLGF